MEYLAQHIESLIFTTEHPISTEDIQAVLEETFDTAFEVETLEKTLEELKDRYKEPTFAFELVEIANGFQFLTKGSYHQTVGTYLRQTTKKRLSRAAIETLSMVAYKQPVSKGELEKIRGVSCDYSIQKLLEKELVTILGRSDSPGRPLLYGTTEKFMDYFGIKSLKELPKPKDFKNPDSEIGEAAPIEEDVIANGQEPGIGNAVSETTEEKEGFVIDDVVAVIAAIGGEVVARKSQVKAVVNNDEESEVLVIEPDTELESDQEDQHELDVDNELDTDTDVSSEVEGTSIDAALTAQDETEAESIEQEIAEVLDADKTDGISNADVSIETLDGAFEQDEQE